MELTIALALSILGTVISVSNFVLNRKDKAVKDKEEQDKTTSNQASNQVLIDYRLGQVEKKIDKIIDILDNYDIEIDKKIDKAMEQHIKMYHSNAK